MGQTISQLNPVLRGWYNYYQHAKSEKTLQELDGWIRRKLRCICLKQCKRVFTLKKFLHSQGVSEKQSWLLALSGKGWWRKSHSSQAHKAMDKDWFMEQGLYSLEILHQALNHLKKPPCA